MARSVKVEIEVDSTGAVKSVKSVEGALLDFTVKGEQASQRWGASAKLMFGTLLAGLAARAVAELGHMSRALFEIATHAEETASAFKATFGEAADGADEFLDAWAHAAGLTKTQGRDMLTVLGGIFRGFGFAKEGAADLSTELIKLAGDIQSRLNVPIQQVLVALRSGITGEMEAMKQFGVTISADEVKMQAATMTGKKLNDEFAQGELVLARMALILERTKHMHGDLADTMGSTANQARMAYGQMQDRAEDLAKSMLPLFGELATAVNSFLTENEEGIRELAQAIGESLIAAVRIIGEFVETTATMIRFVKDNRAVALMAASAWGLYRIAVIAATTAQGLFNAVVRAHPLLLIISAIYLAVTAFRHFKAEIFDFEASFRDWTAEVILSLRDMALAVGEILHWIPGVKSAMTDLAGSLELLHEKQVRSAEWYRKQADDAREAAEKSAAAAAAAGKVPFADIETAMAAIRKALAAANTDFEKQAELLRKMKEQSKAAKQSTKELEEQISQLTNTLNQLKSDEARAEIKALIDRLEEAKAKGLSLRDAWSPLPGSLAALSERIKILRATFEQVTTDQARTELSALIQHLEETRDSIRRAYKETDELDQLWKVLPGSIAFLDQRLSALRDAFATATTQEARDEIAALIEEYELAQEKMGHVQSKVLDLSGAFQDAANQMLESFADALSGSESFGIVGLRILDQLAELAENVGKLMIGFGTAGIAVHAFLSNPFTAIAAGVALLTLAKAARGAIQSEVNKVTGAQPGSIASVDDRLSGLKEDLRYATTDAERRRLQAEIDRLEKEKERLEGGGSTTRTGPVTFSNLSGLRGATVVSPSASTERLSKSMDNLADRLDSFEVTVSGEAVSKGDQMVTTINRTNTNARRTGFAN